MFLILGSTGILVKVLTKGHWSLFSKKRSIALLMKKITKYCKNREMSLFNIPSFSSKLYLEKCCLSEKKKCLKHFSEPYRDAFTIMMTVNKQITTVFAKIQYFQTKMSR